MNRIFTLLIASAIALGSFAQTTVDVVTSAGYENEAYYSFTNGTVSTSPRTDWDISFPTNRYGIYILANNGAQVELYTFPNGNISAWETLDTVGISGWPKMYNSIEYWDEGAFMQNQNANNQLDYGWGKYNMGNHHIVGDSLYVIKTTAGNYKKLWIIDKNPNSGANTWTFKYADIDGENEQSVTLEADPFSAKNHISYSLETNGVIENEPESDNWELLFTKYYDYTIPYYVTGVLPNSARVTVQQVDGVSQATYKAYTDTEFSDTISTIGSDWKIFSMANMAYVLDTNRVFFVKVMDETFTDSTYYKMYFTGFTGSSEGKYTFMQEELDINTSVNRIDEISMLEVFPNPATNQINVIYDIKENVQISIIDLSGNLVYQNQTNSYGFNKQVIDISNLQPGIYTIIVKSKDAISPRKFIKI